MKPSELDANKPSWFVYVLLSADLRRTYVGVTNDLNRRLRQHNGDLPGGARATRSGRPWRLGANYGPFLDRGIAQRYEAALKRRRGFARLDVWLGYRLIGVPLRPAGD